ARIHAQQAAELSGGLGPGEAAMLRHRLSGTDDPAAPVALLLRYGSCARALGEAARQPPRQRGQAAGACQYSLSPDAPVPPAPQAGRPADPDWGDLHARMTPLLDQAARRAPRLASLVTE